MIGVMKIANIQLAALSINSPQKIERYVSFPSFYSSTLLFVAKLTLLQRSFRSNSHVLRKAEFQLEPLITIHEEP